MHALPPDLESHGFATRWRAAAANLSLQGLVLAGAWTLYLLPFAFNDGARGGAMLLQASLPPATAAALLVASMALVEAGRPRGRVRTLAMVASAMAAAALSQVIVMAIMLGTGVWTAPPWPSPVLWWANFGATAMICLGAVLVEDHRVRGSERRAALREARLGAADVVRRTAEVNLQAARARDEPRFLFDALSAVERVYDIDAAAGNRLLDDLVTYLRAVVPDLRETRPEVDREAEIASLRAAIERAIATGTEPTGGPA